MPNHINNLTDMINQMQTSAGTRCLHGNTGKRLLIACRTRAIPPSGPGSSSQVDKGFSLLEWTNKLLPQSALVSGVKEGWKLTWQTMVKELAPQSKTGAYKRPQYTFNNRIGDPGFPVESGRYHLYVGNACPWCHRVLLAWVLRGLARPAAPGSGSSSTASVPHVTITRLADDPTKARRGGWIFSRIDPDPVFGAADLWEVYDTARPGFQGRCTAPLLIDKKTKKIVSNESSDIIRMLNDLHLPGCTEVDLYPEELRGAIDKLNDQIYNDVNNGVYSSGFATSQTAYDASQQALYSTLDQLEMTLSSQPFLLGDKVTEADLRLLPTISRFDAVYASIFKCTRKRIRDYPALSSWMHRMWGLHVPGSTCQVSQTVDVDAARQSYFTNLFPLNPSGIVPAGPTAQDLGLTSTPPSGNVRTDVEQAAHKRRQDASLKA